MIPISLSAARYHSDIKTVLRRLCYTINGAGTPNGYLNRAGGNHCHTTCANHIKKTNSNKELLVFVGLKGGSRVRVLHSFIVSDAQSKRIVSDVYQEGKLQGSKYEATMPISGQRVEYVVIDAYKVQDIKALANDMDRYDVKFSSLNPVLI